MSQPFEIPYSIVLDSSGNGQYNQQFGNDYWYGATVSGTTPGTPTWRLQRNSIFLQPAVGGDVAMSAGVMAPGTMLTINVFAGLPNATVTGYIYGSKSSNPAEISVPIALPSSPGIVMVPQRFQLKQNSSDPSYVYNVPYDGAVHTFTFPLPPGTLTVRWWFLQPPGTPAPSWTLLNIKGNNTGSSYGIYTSSFNGSGGLTGSNVTNDATFRVWPADTAVVVTAQFANNGTTAAPFQMLLEASLIQDVVKAIISGEGNNNAELLGLFDFAPLYVRTSTLAAPPWQVAQFSTPLVGGIGPGASQQIAAAPGSGLAIYLHNVLFIPGTAGTFGKVTDGTSRGEWSYANGNPIPMPYSGFKCAANSAVSITNDSGVNLGTEAGMATYSIGSA